MIKKVRMKFIAIITSSLLVVVLVVILTLNIFLQVKSVQQAEEILSAVSEADGISFLLPHEAVQISPPDPMISGAARIFYVKTDSENNVLEVNHEMLFGFTDDMAIGFAVDVLAKGAKKGTYQEYRFLITQKDYGKMISFVEISKETLLANQLIYISIIVLAITSVALLLLAVLLSNWMVKPAQDALASQKRFVSDASHELKTPLTVIMANTDVLEHEIGQNIRLSYIREQSERMSVLIQDLLYLTSVDEGMLKQFDHEFNMSDAVLATLLAFESVIYEQHKNLSYDIDKDIQFVGDEAKIKQLITILLDNAIRYSGVDGSIYVSLHLEGNKVRLSMLNSGEGMPLDVQNKVFERFYRKDGSRSRLTGGYGLGLAIAKSIVELHKGSICVVSEIDKWTRFIVEL